MNLCCRKKRPNNGQTSLVILARNRSHTGKARSILQHLACLCRKIVARLHGGHAMNDDHVHLHNTMLLITPSHTPSHHTYTLITQPSPITPSHMCITHHHIMATGTFMAAAFRKTINSGKHKTDSDQPGKLQEALSLGL